MKAVAQYNRQNVLSDLPTVQPQMAEPRFFNELAGHVQQFEQRYSYQAKQKYAIEMDTTKKMEINRIAQENKGNPEAMQNAFSANKQGLTETIVNDDLKESFANSYDIDTLPFINRAQAEKERRLDEENTVAALKNINTTKDAILSSVPDLWSNDPVVLQTAGRVIQKGLKDIEASISAKKGDGTFLFNPDVVANGMRPYVDEIGKHLALAHIEKSNNKIEAINDFLSGNINIDMDDGSGSTMRFNIKQSMTPEGYEKTKQVIDAKVVDMLSREALSLHNEDSEKAYTFIKKSIPKGYEGRDDLIEQATTEYAARLNLSMRINKENKLLNNSQLLSDLDASIQTGTSDNLAIEERILNIEDVGTRSAFRNYRAQVGFVQTDPAVLMMLSKMAKENPNLFIDTDLTHYIDRLSVNDRQSLQSAQSDLLNQKKGGVSDGKYTDLISSADHTNRYMKLLGVEEKENPEEYYKAKKMLEIAVNDFETSQLGGKRKANTQEVDAIITRLAGDFKEEDWVFDNNVKLKQFAGEPVEKRAKVYQPFEKIEGDDIVSLRDFFTSKGVVGEPTKDDKIKRLYEKMYPAILARDTETIDFLIKNYKGRK